MRSRKRYTVAVAFLAAAFLLTAMFAANAFALPTFTQAVGGVGPCETCHGGAYPTGVHAVAAHSGFISTCATCHPSGTATPPVPTACAASNCHGGAAAILTAHAGQPAPGAGCATTVGCHGVVVAVPVVSSFLPVSGVVGTTVTLTGTGFPGATGVTFNGVAAATFTVVTPTSITVKVPAGATTGAIAVTTSAGTGTSADSFTVTVVKAKITKLSPTAGKRGSTVTITGTDFGATRGTSSVKFGSTKVSKYVSWSATKVKVKVPSKAKFGKVKVTVTTSAGTSNSKTFTVKK